MKINKFECNSEFTRQHINANQQNIDEWSKQLVCLNILKCFF